MRETLSIYPKSLYFYSFFYFFRLPIGWKHSTVLLSENNNNIFIFIFNFLFPFIIFFRLPLLLFSSPYSFFHRYFDYTSITISITFSSLFQLHFSITFSITLSSLSWLHFLLRLPTTSNLLLLRLPQLQLLSLFSITSFFYYFDYIFDYIFLQLLFSFNLSTTSFLFFFKPSFNLLIF